MYKKYLIQLFNSTNTRMQLTTYLINKQLFGKKIAEVYIQKRKAKRRPTNLYIVITLYAFTKTLFFP